MGGEVSLGLALAAAIASVIAASFRPNSSSDQPPIDTRLLHGALAALWAAVGLLQGSIMRLDTRLAYVAEQTRPGMSLPLRLSALWSGAEGSLLFFTAIAASVLTIGHRNSPRWQRLGVGVVIAGLTMASWRGANPFEVLDLPPLAGAGMAPILEHYAMVVHPPMLYLGMCLALAPALVRRTEFAHRLALSSLAILTVALGFGSAWAYVELGWGGWWAWDPIENVALVVWFLLAAALHWQRLDRDRQVGGGVLGAEVLWALCWPAVLGGAALTRTSLRTSVHAFADASQLAVWLWPLVVLSGVGAALRIREAAMARPNADDGTGLRWWTQDEAVRRGPQLVLVVAAALVAAGTYRPFIPGAGTAGFFYSRSLFPIVIIGAALIAILPLWRSDRAARETIATAAQFGLPVAAGLTLLVTVAGWTEWYQLMLAVAIGFAAGPVIAGGRTNVARFCGHLGVLLIVFAALAGTASTESAIRLVPGESGTLDGHTIEVVSTDLISEDPLQAAATVRVDDSYDLTPSVTVYPERALRLPEVSTRTRPWLDTQAVLRDVHPTEGALITVLFRPWNQLVWWGVALLTGAALLSIRRGDKTEPAPAKARAGSSPPR